jgi:CrcB protein
MLRPSAERIDRLGGLHGFVQVGTLAANLVGGYLVGLALGFFAGQPDLAPEWRLFVITGFLGGLTTFSSFSGESVTLLQRGEVGWALAHTALHLFGSLLLCAAGFATWRALRG